MTTTPASDLNTPVNRHATCPYLWLDGTHCISGCREEPRCITDEPRTGWQLRDAAGRFVPRSTDQMKAIAQQRWIDYRAANPLPANKKARPA
jgi:hypothetical protein